MNPSILADGVTAAPGPSLAVAPARAAALDPAEARQVKRAMRDRIRTERQGRDSCRREADAWGIAAVALEQPEIATARCVAAYASTSTAPGTLPLLRALRAGGVRVLLPVVLDDGTLDWSQDGPDGPDGVASGRLGREAIALAGVVIVPALAVDSLGNRLGQGTGFYDRTIGLVDPTVTVFALVHESEVLDAAIEPVPAEPHDRPVDAVLTPRRCLRLPPHRRT